MSKTFNPTYRSTLKAYMAGAQAKRDGKPSNVPPGLTKDQKKAWRNGYNQS